MCTSAERSAGRLCLGSDPACDGVRRSSKDEFSNGGLGECLATRSLQQCTRPPRRDLVWRLLRIGGKPDSDGSTNGKLELIDPRAGANILPLERGLFEGRYLVEPMPGLMVMFPSWLKHMVHPFQGSGERISISSTSLYKSSNKQSEREWSVSMSALGH